MTIQETFLKKEQKAQEQQQKQAQTYVRELGEKINNALLDPKFIKKVTPLLEEKGEVQFSDAGCLCQGGFCSHQKGFTDFCQEAIVFWKKEGVIVRFGITSGLSVKQNPPYIEDYAPKVKLYDNN